MIPIPVVRQTAFIKTWNLRYYECRFCGFEDKVRVRAIGGGASAVYGSESEAEDAARHSAQVDENEMLKLCPCPKCGRRDSAGFITQWVIVVLATSAVAALTRIDHRPGEKPTECFFRFGGITVWRPADN